MSAWTELVATALLGTRRRSLHPDTLPAPIREQHPTHLLDAAAMMAAYHRAGRMPDHATTPLDQAPEDSRVLIPPPARRRLNRMLAGEHLHLLPDWLDLVSRTEFRLPPESLPTLAELARVRPLLRAPFTQAAGTRAAWLGALNPEWSYLTPSTVDDSWKFGDLPSRLLWLRTTAPDQAKQALADQWPHEPATNRAQFLNAIGPHLDEDFLESALDDRSQEVRARAADLLAARPTSAFGARMAARLTALVTVGEATIDVRLPATRTADMARDGVPTAPARGGQRTAWLGHIIAAAPLAAWPATPADLVALPVTGCDPGILREAWAAACVRQRDPAWAKALLTCDLTTPETAALIGVLPAQDRAAAVAELATGRGAADLAELVIALPAPWPTDLGMALLDWLAAHVDHRAVARAAGVVARTVPPQCLRHRVATEPLPPDAPAWRRTLSETLIFRREMDEELR